MQAVGSGHARGRPAGSSPCGPPGARAWGVAGAPLVRLPCQQTPGHAPRGLGEWLLRGRDSCGAVHTAVRLFGRVQQNPVGLRSRAEVDQVVDQCCCKHDSRDDEVVCGLPRDDQRQGDEYTTGGNGQSGMR